MSSSDVRRYQIHTWYTYMHESKSIHVHKIDKSKINNLKTQFKKIQEVTAAVLAFCLMKVKTYK